jgi:hypothetical protein
MRKAIKKVVLFSLPLFVACGGSKEPVNEAPTKVELISPVQNRLCIDNNVNFDWSDATDANNDAISYKVEFSTNRGMSVIIKTETVTSSQAQISLDKGVAHYWRVTPIDIKGLAGEPSSVFAFYTKGTGTINIVPFTANLVSPNNESELTATTVSVDLKWVGADSDNDVNTLKYDVFFDENTNPTTLIEENFSASLKNVTVATGKTYYWKVNTIDPSGAKSIGQAWSFKVN